MQTFGKKLKNKIYIRRHGSYGIFLREGRIAAIQFSQGCFLPGGGIDDDENAQEALKREALEELGWEIAQVEPLCIATQFFYTAFQDKYIENVGHFFLVKKMRQIAEALEEDHTLVWLTPAQARRKLYHEHQRWAVAQAFTSPVAQVRLSSLPQPQAVRRRR